MDNSAFMPTDHEAHAVQFYTDDEFLLSGLCEFLRTAFSEGQSVVMVMTAAHAKGLMKHLRSADMRVRSAVKQGRFVILDAAQTLTKFMDGDTPVREKFISLMGSVMRRASVAAVATDKPVAAFGEMVAVLWLQRRFSAAIELERLWNDLAETHHLYLRCAYPASGFPDDMKVPYATVCAEHSHVISAAHENRKHSSLGTSPLAYSSL